MKKKIFKNDGKDLIAKKDQNNWCLLLVMDSLAQVTTAC